MSRRANCWDNAPAERFFLSLKFENREAAGGTQNQADTVKSMTRYVDYDNHDRRHSTLNYVSPAAFEIASQTGRLI